MDSELRDLLDLVASERDAQRVAEKTLPGVINYVGAQRGSLFLLANGLIQHKILANKHSFPETREFKVATAMSEGLAGWVLKHRQGGLSSDTSLDERWVMIDGEQPSSGIVVPMISRNEVIGLWSLHHDEQGHFRERHLARAAEAANLLAPFFDATMLMDSCMTGLMDLCRETSAPSVLIDWSGQVHAVNPAMTELDIVWPDAEITQSLLIRELGADSHREFQWDGRRDLRSLPFAALSKRFAGVAYWIQLAPK